LSLVNRVLSSHELGFVNTVRALCHAVGELKLWCVGRDLSHD
jgi:hypothetical protein